jgi:hypothetical protein
MKTYLFAFLLTTFNYSGLQEWKTLETPEYSIQYKADWVLDQSGQSGTKFMLYSPSIQGQVFKNNINLIIQDLKGQNIDLKKFVDISTDQIQKLITSSKIILSQTTNSRHEIVYTGAFGQFSLKWKQYYWVKDEKAYVLTFTADSSSFEGAVGDVTKTMDSFKIAGK